MSHQHQPAVTQPAEGICAGRCQEIEALLSGVAESGIESTIRVVLRDPKAVALARIRRAPTAELYGAAGHDFAIRPYDDAISAVAAAPEIGGDYTTAETSIEAAVGIVAHEGEVLLAAACPA